ncbi:hypothetical protein [Catellatospora coxensis]|uniref:Uncharacterized protein n=1 Tax=Catellatospora coxensis TaxID=310354 RepID=A0A8J3LD74_9ACTN|nr:hypothetical protein [Catellatospora coxensis]GIG10530.1 hypothetical protein Cco03nite_72300 [Catellatospora coxensis]
MPEIAVPESALPDSPTPRSRRIAVIVGLVVGGLLAGGVGTALTARAVLAEPEPRQISVIAPPVLGGRPRMDDTHHVETLLKALPDLLLKEGVHRTGSFYRGADGEYGLLMYAQVGGFASEEVAFDNLFAGMAEQGFPVLGSADVPPGPLGGRAACGTVTVTELGKVLPACGWADRESYGWILWYTSTVEQARAEFAGMREQIELVGPRA